MGKGTRPAAFIPQLLDDDGGVPQRVGRYQIANVDAFEWLQAARPGSIHAVVTDPPYGLLEYTDTQLEKRRNVRGGVWRIPPSFDGCERMPLPRFTVLTQEHKRELQAFFVRLAQTLMPVLVPGAHMFIATNPLVSHFVYVPLMESGFEKRGEVIRGVRTLRGGDRPKNAHEEFKDVTVMPRACWEPWGLFRKPVEGTVVENLRRWGTGALRRISPREPFKDLIFSSPARGYERKVAPHPSLKPQHFLRQIVRAALPLGKGLILDPFMGSGSTVAAAIACGLDAIGLEVAPEFFAMAEHAIPLLEDYRPRNANGQAG